MIHCTNLKRFPQYFKCPRVNHSITSDENSLRPPCERPGIPSRAPASLSVILSVSKWVGVALWANLVLDQGLFQLWIILTYSILPMLTYLLLDPIGSLDILGILCLFVWLISQIQHHISSYPSIQVNSGVFG